MDSLSSLYKNLLDHFVVFLEERLGDNLISVILYGSMARGTAGPESDVDILLVLQKASPVYKERLEPVLSGLRQVRKGSSWQELMAQGIFPELNAIVLSREEAEQSRYLYLDMIDEAQILLDRGGFFNNRLNLLKTRLQELGAKKVRHNGDWYWDISPNLRLGDTVVL